MIIQVRYDTMYYCDVVGYLIQRCHLRCLASLKASIVLVSYCLQVVAVAVIN